MTCAEIVPYDPGRFARSEAKITLAKVAEVSLVRIIERDGLCHLAQNLNERRVVNHPW
jgi:hypothetical protein